VLNTKLNSICNFLNFALNRPFSQSVYSDTRLDIKMVKKNKVQKSRGGDEVKSADAALDEQMKQAQLAKKRKRVRLVDDFNEDEQDEAVCVFYLFLLLSINLAICERICVVQNSEGSSKAETRRRSDTEQR
jgi:hypothetical protein